MTVQRILLPLVVSTALTTSAWAQTATTSFTVTANVIAACVVAAANLAFGDYNPTSATALDGSTTVTVTCTPGTNYTIALNNGANFTTTRRMASGANFLGYELYKDSGRTQRWGSSGGEILTPGSPAGITPSPFTVFGRVPATQAVPTGGYLDTVGVTVTIVP
ncbi:MAG TPA: spore coat U domain-containing protein [Vineibacter sp.]|nr:spore coat U domain-containing protein [Vineibacter sp.]